MRVEVLVNGPQLQAAEAQVLDAVREPLDAVRVVWVHRAPALETVRMLAHELGHRLLRAANPREGRLDGEDNNLVAAFGRLQKLLGPAVEVMLPAGVVHGAMHVRRQAHLRLFGGPGELDEFLGEMVGIPKQVGMDVYEHGALSRPG